MSNPLIYHTGIIGFSYFGSGGGWGRIHHTKNCRTVEYDDNGFASGPCGWAPIDESLPAYLSVSAGDGIGKGKGRRWDYEAWWSPEHREWFLAPPTDDYVSSIKRQRGLAATREIWDDLVSYQIAALTEGLGIQDGSRVWLDSADERFPALCRKLEKLGHSVRVAQSIRERYWSTTSSSMRYCSSYFVLY